MLRSRNLPALLLFAALVPVRAALPQLIHLWRRHANECP
jgi:hypothetical protein